MCLSLPARFCVIVLSFAVPSLFGQFEAATVLGTIRDASGAERNIIHAPAFYGFDFGLHKNFSLFSESRAEAFNLRNKTNFAPPGTLSANSGCFGVFSQTVPARQVQLALKLVF